MKRIRTLEDARGAFEQIIVVLRRAPIVPAERLVHHMREELAREGWPHRVREER